MANIKKAIEIEEYYLSCRMKGEYPFHLIDKIKECGFDDLSQYHEEKRNYKFKEYKFEVIETTPVKAIAEVLKTIAQKKIAVLFADTTNTIVWTGDGSEFNVEYCLKNGIPVLPLQTSGGTIVSTVGDLNIGICMPSDKMDANFILNGLANIFRKYTDKEVVIVGNDILVDNYKVLGSSNYNANGMFMFITPVSMTEKSELIDNICIKKSNKTPSYIDFMTNEELRQEVSEWLTV